MVRNGWEALPEGWEWSGGPPRGPGVVGRPSGGPVVVGMPSRWARCGLQALPKGGNGREALPVSWKWSGIVGNGQESLL